MWRKGGGGRSVYKQPGTRVDGNRATRKGGIQVSKRDSGTGEGSSRQRGIIKGIARVIKGIVKGLSKGLCHVPPV
jgi:hypothetical protein